MGNTRRRRAERMGERVWIEPKGDTPGYWYAPNATKHGTWSGYNNWYCRCPACKAVNTKKSKRWRAREAEGTDS